MTIRKLAAISATAAALCGASLTIGAGAASADDPWLWPSPPGPGVVPSPGHVGQFTGVPPGQWGKGPVDIPICHDLNPGCINHL